MNKFYFTLFDQYIGFSSFRQPLQEIKNELLETPMSVTDALSPMSVDKSMLNQSISNMSFVRANEIDRYFEMIDYQIDVLDYLREAEVKTN